MRGFTVSLDPDFVRIDLVTVSLDPFLNHLTADDAILGRLDENTLR